MMERISLPGFYRGYSAVVADGYIRSSRYVAARDGCRLATDIFLPTLSGAPLGGPRPTVMAATGYRRAWRHSDNEPIHMRRRFPHLVPGDIATYVNHSSRIDDGRVGRWDPDREGFADLSARVRARGSVCEYMLIHGYAVVIVDVRATGASFGKNYGDGWLCGRDLVDVMAWMKTQPWCDGKIGMIGASWLGATQYFTITYNNPHLTAAIPEMAGYDMYYSWFPGGACVAGFVRSWSERRQGQEHDNIALAVDEDADGTLLARARLERREDKLPTDQKLEKSASFDDLPTWTRDRALAEFPTQNLPGERGETVNLTFSALDFGRAKSTSTAVYFYAGWWDMFTRAVVEAFRTLRPPKKLLVGPWHHQNFWDHEEAHRWFDYWLKGIDNGIMDESPVVFATSRGDGAIPDWSVAEAWPLKEEQRQILYLDQRGAIAEGVPPAHAPPVEFRVDYSASAGQHTRSYYHAAPHLNYDELHRHDAKGLMFETAPLPGDIEISGHPIVTLHMTSSALTGIVVAYLEEVRADGALFPISEGVLNLEFRTLDCNPPIDCGPLPYRSYMATSRAAVVPGETMRIEMDLAPVSFLAMQGHRLRLTIHGADRDNFYTAELAEPPNYCIYLDAARPSSLDLPIVPPTPSRQAAKRSGAFRDMPPLKQRACDLTHQREGQSAIQQ